MIHDRDIQTLKLGDENSDTLELIYVNGPSISLANIGMHSTKNEQPQHSSSPFPMPCVHVSSSFLYKHEEGKWCQSRFRKNTVA